MSAAGASSAPLRSLVAVGLPGCSRPLPDEPLDDTSWNIVCGEVRSGRLEGPLAAAIDCGGLPVTDAQYERAAGLHRSAMALTLVLDRELLATVDALDHAGVSCRVLKGPAIAHLDEADPSNRAYGDIDLLVPGERLPDAIRVLEDLGGARRFPEPRPGFDRRFTKGISFAFDRNLDVDLHRTLALGPFGMTIDTHELLAASSPVTIGGRRLLALDRPGRFIHAAAHGVLGSASPRLAALRDLVLTAPADRDETREVLRRVHRWQLDAPVAVAVDLARDWLGWRPSPLLDAWADDPPVSARHRRWLAGYRGAARSSMRMSLGAVEALPGARARVAYAWAVAAPRDPAGGATTRWRRGIGAARRRADRR